MFSLYDFSFFISFILFSGQSYVFETRSGEGKAVLQKYYSGCVFEHNEAVELLCGKITMKE